MNIGIVELQYHSEFLHTIIQLFAKENVTVFTTRSIYNELPNESKKANFCLKHSKQRTKDFLSSIRTQDYDYLFVNTIQPSMVDIPAWKNFKPKCTSILTLHNLNAWNTHTPYLRKNLLHTIDSFAASFLTKSLINKFDNINVVYSPLTSLAKMYFPLHNILNIPYAFAQKNIKIDKKETIDVVVPGTVTQKRRNYHLVMKAFEQLLKKHSNLRLILLGKNVDNISMPSTDGVEEQVLTFDKYVPPIEYHEHLRQADVVLVPSLFGMHSVNTAEELYGLSKSPNIHEAIKWRKALLVPEYISVDHRLQTSTQAYTSYDDLLFIISHLLKNPSLLQKQQQNAITNTKPFLLQNIRKKVYEDLELT